MVRSGMFEFVVNDYNKPGGQFTRHGSDRAAQVYRVSGADGWVRERCVDHPV